MADPPSPPPPENSALAALRHELDDAAVDHFVADFLTLLDQRLTALDRLVARRRWDDAVTMLLTIETSGQMVGAHELAAAAGDLRHSVGDDEPQRVSALLAQVHTAGVNTKRLLHRL